MRAQPFDIGEQIGGVRHQGGARANILTTDVSQQEGHRLVPASMLEAGIRWIARAVHSKGVQQKRRYTTNPYTAKALKRRLTRSS